MKYKREAMMAANAAVAASHAAFIAMQKAKRASIRKRMNITNLLPLSPEKRQSSRIQESTMKALRRRLKNKEKVEMREMAETFADAINKARKTEKAAEKVRAAAAVNELESLMSGMKVGRKNNNVNNIGNAMRRMGF
jgi:hypothetical protein